MLGLIGVIAVLGLSAMGSGSGVGYAGMSAIGAWKKCYLQNKPAPFILAALSAFPMSQTLYGFILMQQMIPMLNDPNKSALVFGIGIFSGAAIGLSALFQGKAAASACDAYGETGKGNAQYILVLGLIETVALFVLVFTILLLSSVNAA
jgi:V/A-type H+-transporting ATPase subunit K